MNRDNMALQDIIAYEKQLLADREQLHKLLELYQGESDEIVRDKLHFFQSELKHMNHQYELLKKNTEAAESPASAVQSAATSHPDLTLHIPTQTSDVYARQQGNPALVQSSDVYAHPQIGQPTNQPSHVYPRPQTDRITERPESPMDIQKPSNPSQKQFAGFEKMVGSSLMGILASGLIFISLILFATLIMPYLGQAVKLAACYMVSLVMIGVSLFKLRKDEHNKFYLALAGCGVGALYITLLLTNIYFKYIGDIPLFVLITVWVGFVCYLSKSQNAIFHVIGQIGVTISLIFGTILCVDTGNVGKFLSLIIFYIISFGTLYIAHFNKEAAFNKIGNSFGCANLYLLFFANLTISEEVFYLLFLVIALAHLTALFLQTWEKSQISYGIFVSVFGIMLALSIFNFIDEKFIMTSGIIVYLVAMVILFLTEFKPKTYHDGMAFAQVTMILQACVGLAFHELAYTHGFVWLIILPVILLGFFRSNEVAKYGSTALTWFYLSQYIPDVERFVMGLLAVLALYILSWVKKDKATLSFKICLHLLGLILFLFTGWDLLDNYIESEEIIIPVVFMVISIYNVGLSKSPFSRNLLTGEKESPAHYNILNVILMLVALIIIGECTPLHIPVILIALVLFFQNSKNMLNMHQNIWAGIYVGIKFTVLLYTILNSFDAINYIISSSFLLFAVASIVIGFAKEYKSLRVYGLVLSMISVFKLVMLDIRYENTLGNALSFFISGVLCFAISMIYNYIDKKMGSEKENEE